MVCIHTYIHSRSRSLEPVSFVSPPGCLRSLKCLCFPSRATHDARCLQYRILYDSKKKRGQDSLKGYPHFKSETWNHMVYSKPALYSADLHGGLVWIWGCSDQGSESLRLRMCIVEHFKLLKCRDRDQRKLLKVYVCSYERRLVASETLRTHYKRADAYTSQLDLLNSGQCSKHSRQHLVGLQMWRQEMEMHPRIRTGFAQIGGTTCLTLGTCLIRPHVLYACFVVSRITTIC